MRLKNTGKPTTTGMAIIHAMHENVEFQFAIYLVKKTGGRSYEPTSYVNYNVSKQASKVRETMALACVHDRIVV